VISNESFVNVTITEGVHRWSADNAEGTFHGEKLNLSPLGEQPRLLLGFNLSTQQPQSMQATGTPKKEGYDVILSALVFSIGGPGSGAGT